ncbi:DUF1254 domain-containing protein [Dyella jiangningensis]|uniref:DUF1254 domain-containing protein n=1 Tax=Dyella jiangningensis TaxID=1379159 RepID=A0A328PAH8_9GAMM|nr:DUF1254 domain-containing protein [Dyella jiangningensis]RAO78223.1 hypothetical protein CA260_10500 [Dyella jiangningensis]
MDTPKSNHLPHHISLTIALLCASAGIAHAQPADQPAITPTAAALAPPADILMTKEYVATVGRMAYLWGWPIINERHRRAAFNKAPESGLLGGVLPVAPENNITMLTDYIAADEHFVTCPNQDVTYGFGFGDLSKDAVVVQVPDFGDRFWVYALYDARSDSFGQLGKQYGTKPGMYLIVGPDWRGKVPAGIAGVIHSPTNTIGMAPRILMDDTAEDRKAIQTVLRQIMIYPLSKYSGKPQTKEWSKVPHFPAPEGQGSGETQWVNPETFFDELPVALDETPPLPGEEALYAQFRAVLRAAAKDPAIRDQLKHTAIDAEKNLIGPLFEFRNYGVAIGNGWTTAPNGARFGYDYLTRAAVSKSNMYVNRPEETRYFYLDLDSKGERLNGSHAYTVTFKSPPPVNGFWSLTMYNEHHLFEPNTMGRYSLGTKNKNLKKNPDGSLTIYVQHDSPGADKESNWLPSPKGDFSLYTRTYWPKPEINEGKWAPPPAVRAN